jgi:SAM-dependent methyltransferase
MVAVKQVPSPGHSPAALNREWFSGQSQAEFIEGAPHLKHPQLRDFCSNLVREAFAKTEKPSPDVFDMGAGQGTLTIPFLELGANVTAADVTVEFLESLKAKSRSFQDSLTVLPGDIFGTVRQLADQNKTFDLVCASAFLHHIRDYLGLCQAACRLIRKGGVFFTVQDPLRYDTLRWRDHLTERIAYFWWRGFQGDFLRGLKTRWRRVAGKYRDDLAEDTAEYHVVRNGVDHIALKTLLEAEGFVCELRPYWSTQSTFFQRIGTRTKLLSNFALIAKKLDAGPR